MKKKLLIMFLAGTMAISLSACGGSDDSKKDSKAKTEQTNDEKEQKEAEKAQAAMDAKYNPNNISPADYSNTDEYLAAWINGVEQNTSEMVDTIAHAAKASANYSSSSEKGDEALSFISALYPNYFTDNSVMEKTMYYGYYLEYAYAKNVPTNLGANVGMDTYQAVKYVYRGSESTDGQHITSNLDQIKDELSQLGYSVQ